MAVKRKLYAECARLTGRGACWAVVQTLQLKARKQQGISPPSPLLAAQMPDLAQPRWVESCMSQAEWNATG